MPKIKILRIGKLDEKQHYRAGAVEPPYFAGVGAGILVKNGSGYGLAKIRDFLLTKIL